MGAVDTARENATLREEFLRRGLVPEEELDRLGWVSHADLDLWEEAGVLELGVGGLQEAWGLGLLHGDIFNRRIIRGRGGKFGGVIGGPQVKPQSERRIRQVSGPRVESVGPHGPAIGGTGPIKELKGRRGGVRGKRLAVYETPPKLRPTQPRPMGRPERMSAEQMHAEATSARDLHNAGRARLGRLAREETAAGVKAARAGDHAAAREHHEQARAHENAMKDPAQTLAHGQAELYQKRSKRLEKRIARNVKKAGEQITPAAGAVRGEHDLSAAEVHFNDAGRVSQKTLLAYAEEAARNPTTAEMYRNKDGDYHPSRAALHADIIDKLLRQHEATAEGKDAGLSGTKDYLKPPKDGKPTVIFTGGGYAAGKGGVQGMLKAENQWPDDAMLLDPDLIKAELPEFQAAATGGPRGEPARLLRGVGHRPGSDEPGAGARAERGRRRDHRHRRQRGRTTGQELHRQGVRQPADLLRVGADRRGDPARQESRG